MKKVLKEYQPSVIHAHDMRASFIVSRSAGRIPFLSHIHNNAYNSRAVSLKSIAYLFAGLKAKHIFWVSKSAYQGYAFHRFLKQKSSILYNVIDVEKLYKKMNQDGNTYYYDIVFVGRMTYPKNPHRLISVLSKVIEKKSDVKIAIIGNGELDEEIRKLSDEKGLSHNISFLGFQPNPLKIMYNSKVMIMTSRWEGTPMCALEAMALGLPIVSTPTDGMCDLIENDANGFLSDDDIDIAEKLLKILKDDLLREKLSKEQIRKAENINDIFSYKRSVKNQL